MNELNRLTDNTVIHMTRLLKAFRNIRADREALETVEPGSDEHRQISADLQKWEAEAYREETLCRMAEEEETAYLEAELSKQAEK